MGEYCMYCMCEGVCHRIGQVVYGLHVCSVGQYSACILNSELDTLTCKYRLKHVQKIHFNKVHMANMLGNSCLFTHPADTQ